jgi:hypothetical protein
MEAGPGTLVLRTTNVATGDTRETSLVLDPLNPSGFWMEEWPQGSAVVICGAARILVLEASSLDLRAVVPFEHEECETLEHPWFVMGESAVLIATESRVFRFDVRPALLWCWTVRVYSTEWFALVGAPVIDDNTVRIKLRSAARDVEVRVGLDDAFMISRN